MGDYALNLINKAVGIVCGLVSSIVLARYLGVVARGEYAYITTTGSLIAIILGMGISQSFIRDFKRRPAGATLSEAMSVLLLQLLLFAVIGAAALVFVRNGMIAWIAVLALATAGFQQLEAMMAAYDIRLKMRLHMAYSITRMLAFVAAWLLVPSAVAVPVGISTVCALAVVGVYLVQKNRPPLHLPSPQRVRDMIGFGWLPMITSLLVVLNYNVDVLMLRSLGSGADLGLYSVAVSVVTYLWVIPDAIKEVLLSRIVRSHDQTRVVRPLKAAVIAAMGSVLAFAATGWFLVPVLFGPDFSGAYILIVILGIGVTPMVYYKVLGAAVLAEGRRVFYFFCLASAVLMNVGLNLFVIPLYGATGAAWVSVLSYLVTGGAFLAYFCRLTSLSPVALLAITRDDLRAVALFAKRAH